MIEDQIFEEIQKAQSILLHLHPSPDPDSQGSALAMYHALTGLGKKVTVIKGDSDIDPNMAHMPGADKIVPKNFLEIDQKEFDLFLILDAGSKNRITNLAPFEFTGHLTTIIIDHHVTNDGFAKLDLIDPTVPATALILFRLFKKWGIPFTNAIARNLLLGIYTDTGNFTHANVTEEALLAAVELRKLAPEFTTDLQKIYTKSFDTLRFESLAYRKVETVKTFAVCAISLEDIQKENIAIEAASASLISGILRSVGGFDAAVCLVEDEPEKVKCSFRTNNPDIYDVSKIAKELGGGGHRAAAGALFLGSMQDAKTRVLSLINQYTK